jgi:hypothetical protein
MAFQKYIVLFPVSLNYPFLIGHSALSLTFIPICDRSLSCLDTETSIKSGAVCILIVLNLFLSDQTNTKTKKMFELSSFTLFPIRVLLCSDDVVFYLIVHRLYTYAYLELCMYTDLELCTYTDLETTIIYNIIEFNIKFVIIFILISK